MVLGISILAIAYFALDRSIGTVQSVGFMTLYLAYIAFETTRA